MLPKSAESLGADVKPLTRCIGKYNFCAMENDVAKLRSELAAITLWNWLFAEGDYPDEIENDACVARFCRRQVIVERLRELSADN